MAEHLKIAYDILDKNSSYIMVVGNSSVSNFKIETAKYICQIGINAGFDLENFWSYEIRNRFMGFDRKGKGGLIDLDHVIEFRK
jgi:hypothetical protein